MKYAIVIEARKKHDNEKKQNFETRYPGEFPEISWDEAEEAYKAAEKIKEFVLEKTKESF